MNEMDTRKIDRLEALNKLSPERRALLARRLKEKSGGTSKLHLLPRDGEGASGQADDTSDHEQHLYSAPPVERAPREGEIPLSFAQQRLWFLDQLEPGKSTYNIIAAVHLFGPLNVAALEASFKEIERRHETLRTRFTSSNGNPVQQVLPPLDTVLRTVDLQELDEEARRTEGSLLASSEAQMPFDLAQGRLFRATLIHLGTQEHALLLTMHHIVSDGWSMGVLVREMMALYKAFYEGTSSTLPELPVQYTDYVLWQRQWLQGDALESQLDYWKRQLAAAPPVLELPTDRPHPPVPSYRGGRESLVLTETLTASLKLIARREGASLFMVLLAAFKVLLSRYSGQEDIIVGTPIANRNRGELEGLIGFFANTLALRTDLRNNPGFTELLGRVRDVALSSYAHQDLPFERLVEELNPERQLSRQPLFQVMFVFQNAPAPTLEESSLTLKPYATELPIAKFDLTLTMDDVGDVIVGSLEYSADLFNQETAARMLNHFETLLHAIAENPDRRIKDLPLISDSERQQLLLDWNSTQQDYGACLPAHELFEAQVEATPNAVAARYEDEEISYRELNSRANQLACYLRKLSVGPESRVGICVERSFEMLVAVLGVMKAGGAYVPLDPAYPLERLAFMLEDSQSLLLLTQERFLASLPEHAGRIICLDTEWDAISGESTENRQGRLQPDNLCYVIYTSGSTGRPKGVAMTHRALSNLIEWEHAGLCLEPGAKTLQFSSPSFDASFNEMFSTWRSGGLLVLVPEETRRDPVRLSSMLAREKVERLLPPYAAFQQLADTVSVEGQAQPVLREILSTAEQLHITPSIIRLMSGMKDCVLHNEYGPSETHVVTAFTLTGAPADWPALPPIGRPIANTQIYLLDSQMQPVPVGVPGELYVGGVSLARGYLNRPDMTAERFIPDPCGQESGARLYKTGDLARYLPGGDIEYLGRIDQQVKVRGYRIELGEIEAAMARHPSISDVAVVAREYDAGQKHLVAYWVAGQKPAPTTSELFSFLRQSLPEYMVPSSYMELEALPLSPNGKVDRRALPVPDHARPTLSENFLSPSNWVEEIVAGIWARVLRLERVGVRDNFFELGGHSLLATQVVSRVRDTFQVEIPLRRLFEAPTVAGLAETVAELLRAGTPFEQAPPISRRASDAPPPVSFAQQRLWFTDQLEPGSSTFNIAAAMRLGGALDVRALERSLDEVVRRHEALRTTFRIDEATPVQVIHPTTSFHLPVIDLSPLRASGEGADDAIETEARRLAVIEAQRGFDLEHDPLLRVGLVKLDDEDYLLLLTMHHIVSDAWSMNVLIREVTALYEAFRAGKESPLSPLTIQYADYAVWQREWLTGDVLERELAYWKKQLAGAPAVFELPSDRTRANARGYGSGDVAVELSGELRDQLQALSRSEGATLFMVLLAAFKVLLAIYSGQRDIVVGTSVAGRNRGELEDLIGFFVNALVMRTQVDTGVGFRELIRRVREVVIDGQTHQDIPFERLVEELAPERSLDYSPLFQVMFTLNNTERTMGVATANFGDADRERDAAREKDDAYGGVAVSGARRAKYDLNLVLTESAGRISGALEYNAGLFDEETIRRMMAHYRNLLEAVVADADVPVSALPLMNPAERQQVVVEWNQTDQAYRREHCVQRLFEEQAARTPHAPALAYGAELLSYEELNGKANQLAHHLRRLGVKAETPVAIYMERSTEMIVAVLGILKAGAAYVPLDPSYPAGRIEYMLEDSGVTLVLTQQKLLTQLGDYGARAVCFDADFDAIASESRENLPDGATAENIAYVIYTSGSTGRPKGVMIPHSALTNFLVTMGEHTGMSSAEVVLSITTLSFDIAGLEIYLPLINGARIHLASREEASDGMKLVDLIETSRATLMQATPATWQMLTAIEWPGKKHLKVLSGGETLPPHLAAQLLERCGTLWNLYGPTETTIYSTLWRVEPGENILLGRPLANTRAYVLDNAARPVPVAVPGELYLGGDGLARGYLGRPDLTAERFIPDPFGNPGGRLYRTGDVVRWRDSGKLEFLGRADQQLKVRGHRIEPGEIETVLLEHARVQQCAVVARGDGVGGLRLVAYVVYEDAELSGAELREHLRGRLPEYMVPGGYVQLNQLPLTPNGKLDRQALLALNDAPPKSESEFVAPRTPVEEELAALWRELLNVEQVGIHDNFFELGGHSILLIQLHSRISKSFDVKIPLRSMFDVPTIAEITVAIAGEQVGQQDSSEVRQMLDDLKQLSPEEVRALLEAEQESSAFEEIR